MVVDLKVGTMVVCKQKEACVRYVGPLAHAKGDWVGLEFDGPHGSHNGTVHGKKYFDCGDGRGVFVRPGAVYVQQEHSAEQHRDMLSSWNAAEAGKEFDHLQAQGIGHAAEALLHQRAPEQMHASARLQRRRSEAAISRDPHEDDWKGPRPKFGPKGEMTKEDVAAVVQHFKNDPDKPLPAYYAHRILTAAADVFKMQCTKPGSGDPQAVYDVGVPSDVGGRLIVCGDTHGQLADLFWVFFKHLPPSRDNIYVMNGDIADRGEHAVEVYLILLAYKLLDPKSVVINKGNHEDDYMNTRYGFFQEVRRKYGDAAGQIYQAFQALFIQFPIATVIDGEVMVIHGGLSRKQVRLEQYRNIRHQRPAPDQPGRCLEDTVFYDSLWSDPREDQGITRNARGGDVIAFGPDVARQFLERSKLKMLIRSHEVPEATDPQGFPKGFEWHHPIPSRFDPLPKQEGLTLTVFTASNYCGSVCNLGAVVVFRQRVSQFEILEHYANSFDYILEVEAETRDATSQMERIAKAEHERRSKHMLASQGRMKSDLMARVKSEITKHKHELFEYWWALDSEKDLHVTLDVWKEGLDTVLQDFSNMNWDEMAKTLVVSDSHSQRVNYPAFLLRFQIRFANKFGRHAGFRRAITDHAFEALMLADLSMRETFAVLDRNDDGLVSVHEFQKVLESSGVGLTRPQIQALFRTIVAHAAHPDQGGRLKVEDFLGRLQLRYGATHAKTADEAFSWVPQALTTIAKDMLKGEQLRRERGEHGTVLAGHDRVSLLTEFFHRADADQSGHLSLEELAAALRELKSCQGYSTQQLEQIGLYIDVVGNKKINYLEFLNAFHIEDSHGPELAEDMLEYIYRVLHFILEQPLRRSFRIEDPDHVGQISKDQFERCLVACVSSRSPPELNKGQIKCLVDTLNPLPVPDDAPEDFEPLIDYEDWLNSFEIIDTNLDEEH